MLRLPSVRGRDAPVRQLSATARTRPTGVRLQVGDGTTTVVILAGELLKFAKPFVEEGLHPRTIISAFRKATALVSERWRPWPLTGSASDRTGAQATSARRRL